MFGKLIAASAILVSATMSAQATSIEERLQTLVDTQLADWLTDAALVDAIRAQNDAHAGLTQADIDALDQTWRAETSAGAQPMIRGVLERPASQYLMDRRADTNGMVTEVFVMDNLGLNVAQSDPTSDYWQGDEDKFIKTFGQGAGTIHVGEIELDESTGAYQVQVSLSIEDPDSGSPIGAATFGIIME